MVADIVVVLLVLDTPLRGAHMPMGRIGLYQHRIGLYQQRERHGCFIWNSLARRPVEVERCNAGWHLETGW